MPVKLWITVATAILAFALTPAVYGVPQPNALGVARSYPSPALPSREGVAGLFRMETDPLLVGSLYAHRHNVIGGETADGAIGLNADWEAGKRTTWYIEEQRYGGELVQAGVATGNRDFIVDGLKVLDWGFAHMQSDGSFGDTGDPFHSASLFLESASRALLLLGQYDSKAYAGTIRMDSANCDQIAHYLLQPDVLDRGRGHDRPYTHRRWALAGALAETASLTGDQKLFGPAADFAVEGLAQQTPDGVNPEKGGPDVSYQVVGLLMAERYALLCPDREMRERVLDMVKKGFGWFLTKVNDDGSISTEGSTRVDVETGRGGKIKHVDVSATLQALVGAALITGDDSYRRIARKVAVKRGWLQ